MDQPNFNADYHNVVANDARWLDTLAHASGQLDIIARAIMSVSPGWQMPARLFSQHVLYYMLDQEVIGEIHGQPIHLRPGSLMWIAPNIPHHLTLKDANKPFTMYNLRFKLWDAADSISFERDFIIHHEAQDHLRLIDLLFDELLKKHPQENTRLQHVIDLLYADLTQEEHIRRSGVLSQRIQSLLWRYMQEHGKQRPRVEDLAQVAGLSTDYFRRRFQKTFGMAPRTWLVRQRIQMSAQALIESPQRQISELAQDFGYEDIYLYSRQFKHVFGISPSQYRQQH